jgi:Family of unknown function (DUF6447)
MTIIKIDGKDYDIDKLSDAAKKQISALQVVDNEMRRLQIQMSIAQTARNVHVQMLHATLSDPMAGDTIKLG